MKDFWLFTILIQYLVITYFLTFINDNDKFIYLFNIYYVLYSKFYISDEYNILFLKNPR